MFSAFERMVAMRYLRPRRKEGFVSVIAGFSSVFGAGGEGHLRCAYAVSRKDLGTALQRMDEFIKTL